MQSSRGGAVWDDFDMVVEQKRFVSLRLLQEAENVWTQYCSSHTKTVLSEYQADTLRAELLRAR